MLTLVATCYLLAQTLFTVPQGWHVTEVYSGGPTPLSATLLLVYCDPACEETKQKPWIKLKRNIVVGEKVEAPDGCTLLVTRDK